MKKDMISITLNCGKVSLSEPEPEDQHICEGRLKHWYTHVDVARWEEGRIRLAFAGGAVVVDLPEKAAIELSRKLSQVVGLKPNPCVREG